MVAIADPQFYETFATPDATAGPRGIRDILRDVLDRYDLGADVESVLAGSGCGETNSE